MIRFSVVIPVYNCEQYLASALESVLRQHFSDLEVVLVDDGSTDKSGSIAETYASEDDRVKVLHGPNEGPLLARRRGLSHCEGEYVVFVDADDCLREDALEIISCAISETGADIVSYGLSHRDDFSKNDDPSLLNPGFYSGDDYQIVKKHVCEGRFNNLCGKAFRLCRIDLESTYGAYKGLMHGEDLFQLLPIVDRSASLTRIEDALYFYRPNNGSSTARYKASQLQDIVRVNHRLLEYAQRWGGGCPEKAAKGEANQYFNLLKMSELTDCGDGEKQEHFADIRRVMLEEGVFGRLRGVSLRPDNQILAFCIKHGWYGGAHAVVRLVEMMKR